MVPDFFFRPAANSPVYRKGQKRYTNPMGFARKSSIFTKPRSLSAMYDSRKAMNTNRRA